MMKEMRKQWTAVCFGVALCAALTACGQNKAETENQETGKAAQTEEITVEQPQETVSQDAIQETALKLIEDQTFQVTLQPLGEVTFSSYEPDINKNPLADAVFTLKKDGEDTVYLEGMRGSNSRDNEIFGGVEAVSFPDCNRDGISDILILCRYTLASGPQVGMEYSEARIYFGNWDGTFTLERGLSQAANSAVEDKTIQTILGFLGAGKTAGQEELEDWQRAYIEYLRANKGDRWEGFDLIYVNNDEIPEVAEIGYCEAAGCGILTFSEGNVIETQLNRLNFTYIERENLLCNSDGLMDSYYDLVYSMEDGRMRMVAAGYYGAEDNSNLQIDENGNPSYIYTFNVAGEDGTLPDSLKQAMEIGVLVTEEEYNKALNAVYDTSKAKWGYREELYSLEELTDLITGYYGDGTLN